MEGSDLTGHSQSAANMVAICVNNSQFQVRAHQIDPNTTLLAPMKPELKSPVHVQRILLTPNSEDQLADCLKVQSGLYLRIRGRDHVEEKIQCDLMFSRQGQEANRHLLSELFQEWDLEARSVGNKIKSKWEIDVEKLGSKNTLNNHVCKFCGKIFNKATALGGHTSKLHSSQLKKPASSGSIPKTLKVEAVVPKHKKIKKKRRSSFFGGKSEEDSNLDVIFEESEE